MEFMNEMNTFPTLMSGWKKWFQRKRGTFRTQRRNAASQYFHFAGVPGEINCWK
jgi:hypothetical protein